MYEIIINVYLNNTSIMLNLFGLSNVHNRIQNSWKRLLSVTKQLQLPDQKPRICLYSTARWRQRIAVECPSLFLTNRWLYRISSFVASHNVLICIFIIKWLIGLFQHTPFPHFTVYKSITFSWLWTSHNGNHVTWMCSLNLWITPYSLQQPPKQALVRLNYFTRQFESRDLDHPTKGQAARPNVSTWPADAQRARSRPLSTEPSLRVDL